MAARFNILILGASYGSLFASKLLFGGHSIRLVCLPAEADLINAEGFRVRLPVRGRPSPVELDSRKLPGSVTAGGTAGAIRPGRAGGAGAAIPVRRRARTPRCRRAGESALHVDHEYAAAQLSAAYSR